MMPMKISNIFSSKQFARIKSNKKLLVSIVMVTVIVFIAILGPIFTTYHYNEMSTGPRLSPPTRNNIFGTDQFGRDLFSRVIYGARYSLIIAILVSIFSSTIGILIGVISGYFGGKTDLIVMRLVDIVFTIPWILIAMVVAIAIGRGVQTVAIALSIIYAPQMARIIRSTSLSLKEKEFVQAGIISGESRFSIITKYILFNSMGQIIVQTTMVLAYAMLAEAALSYIGYGVAPPIPSWGLLLQDATVYYVKSTYLVYFPGLAIIFTVLSFSFLGDGLRDLLDPKFNPLV